MEASPSSEKPKTEPTPEKHPALEDLFLPKASESRKSPCQDIKNGFLTQIGQMQPFLETIPLKLHISPKRIIPRKPLDGEMTAMSPSMNGHASKGADSLCDSKEPEKKKANSKLKSEKVTMAQFYDDYEECMLSLDTQPEKSAVNKEVKEEVAAADDSLANKQIDGPSERAVELIPPSNAEQQIVLADNQVRNETERRGRPESRLGSPKNRRSSSNSSSSSASSSSSSSSSSSRDSSSSGSCSSSDSDEGSKSDSSSSSSDSSSSDSSSASSKRGDVENGDLADNKLEPATRSADSSEADDSTSTLQLVGIDLGEDLLDDTSDLLKQIQLLKQNVEQKRKSKRKRSCEAAEAEASNSNQASNDLICDPNREMISLKLRPSVSSSASTVKNVFESQEKIDDEVTKSTETYSHGAGEKMSDAAASTSSKRKEEGRRSSRGRRHSEERKSRRSDEKRRRRSSERRGKKSEEKKSFSRQRRHRSRSPINEKYSAPSERDGERPRARDRDRDREHSPSRSRNSFERRFSREREYPRFDRNGRPERHRNGRRQSASPPFGQSESSFSLQRRSVSPYERKLSDSHGHSPTRWQHSEYRRMSLSPVPRGPRTPPNTPPPTDPMYDRNLMHAKPDMAYGSQSPPRYKYDHSNAILTQDAEHPAAYQYQQRAHLGPPEYVAGCYSPPRHYLHLNASAEVTPVLGSGDGYYYQTSFGPPQPPPHFNYHQMFQPSYLPPHLNSHPLYVEPNRQITPNVVQIGNVLEIVPSNELHPETVAAPAGESANDRPKSDENDDELMHQRMRAQQEKIRRRHERHQRRIAREKRKEFMISEIRRLSQQFIVGEDGKMIKASELLKLPQFSAMCKASSASPMSDSGATPSQPAPTYDYDATAKAGKSIIVLDDSARYSSRSAGWLELTLTLCSPFRDKSRKKAVVFADGVLPGHGTSASEDSGGDDEDEMSTKNLIARSKNKKRKPKASFDMLADALPLTDKENLEDPMVGASPALNSFAATQSFLFSLQAFKVKASSKTEERQEFVPGPPEGSPLPGLLQPKLKNPDKFQVNRLMYFHYDTLAHLMYISPCRTPTHDKVAPSQMMPPDQFQPVPPPFQFKHSTYAEPPAELVPKAPPRTPLGTQQKPTHSNESNLIVLQSNSPTNSSHSFSPSAAPYNSQMTKAHYPPPVKRPPTAMLYPGANHQHPAQMFSAITAVTTHPTYHTNFNGSPHLSANHFYPSTN